MSSFTKEQIEDLLVNVLDTKITHWKGNKLQFCCTAHGESHPSAGVNIDFVSEDSIEHRTVWNCFSCHASGNMSWLLYKSLPDQFKNLKQADEFLSNRYSIKVNSSLDLNGLKLKRFGERVSAVKQREVLPLSTIAPYKSGKETYEYFYSRGFTSKVVKDFMIGRDLVNETVTVPIFYEDHKLAGVIGRYIDPNRAHNERFKIYDGFKKGEIVFPLDHFKRATKNDIILVEGLFDAIRMHMLGYSNTLTTLTNGITRSQAKLIRERGDKILLMTDNDDMGRIGEERIRKSLSEFSFRTVEFPPETKDPCDCTEEQIKTMMENSRGIIKNTLKRL